MERDEVKGTAKDVKGRIQRQAGEWAGDEEMQLSGAKEQAKGKIQKAAGKVKKTVKRSSRRGRAA